MLIRLAKWLALVKYTVVACAELDFGFVVISSFNSRFKDDDISMSVRNKRHAGEHHHNDDAIELNPNARRFVQKLFKQYGNGEQETMNFTGFEQMLRQLGLYRLIEVEDFSHKKSEPKSSGESGITDAKHAMNTNETVTTSP